MLKAMAQAIDANACWHADHFFFFLPARLPSPFLGGALPRLFSFSSFILRLWADPVRGHWCTMRTAPTHGVMPQTTPFNV